MDIRMQTALVIGRGGEFLVGKVLDSQELRWSASPWDAWRTRIRANARSVAEKTGGEIWLFNPVAGQLRRMEGEGCRETARAGTAQSGR